MRIPSKRLQNASKRDNAIDLGGSFVCYRNAEFSTGVVIWSNRRLIVVASRLYEHSGEASTWEVCEGAKMPEYLTVARVSALPPGMGTVVTVKGQELAVFNVQGNSTPWTIAAHIRIARWGESHL